MKEIELQNLNSRAIIGDEAIGELGGIIKEFALNLCKSGGGNAADEAAKTTKVALVYTKNISPETEKALFESLGGFDFYSFKLKDGEKIKTAEWAELITEFLAINGFKRDDVLVAAGGGTVCDLCGFVASVYMRGIKYINVPTTLLCAVDACIGGKTAIDIPHVKNGWGTFYQPAATVIDTAVIKNLSGEAYCGGISEIVKYALIDKDFCEYLSGFNCAEDFKNDLENLIYNALIIKARAVCADERDEGERKKLNLGHTVAHALEQASGYKMTHGEAVGKGLFAESAVSYIIGKMSEKNFLKATDMLIKFLPDFCPRKNVRDYIGYMRYDKKNRGTKITFSLPTDNGVEICAFSESELNVLLR